MARALCLNIVPPRRRIPISMSPFHSFEGKTDANKACNEDHYRLIWNRRKISQV